MRAVREPVRRAHRDLRGGTAIASVRRRHGRRFGGDPRHDVGFGRRDRFGCCGKICASALASVGAATSAVTNRRSASTLSSLGGMAWGSSSRLLSRRRPPALGWRPVVARQARLTITIEDWPDPVPRFRSRPDFRTRLASFAPTIGVRRRPIRGRGRVAHPFRACHPAIYTAMLMPRGQFSLDGRRLWVVRSNPVRNLQVLQHLRQLLAGRWQEMIKKGTPGEIHDFERESGQIAGVKY